MRIRQIVPIVLLVSVCGCAETPVARVNTPELPKKEVRKTENFAVPVLMYHRVCDLTEKETKSPLVRDLTVSPADFEAQIKYLSDEGFTFLLTKDVQEAVRQGLPLPEKAIAITLDDGYADNFENAFPILRKYGACATIFLVSSTLETPNHLTWDHTRLMQGQVSYGSHTVHHYDLTLLPRNELDFELVEAKKVLEAKLGPILDLAYPSGEFNGLVVERTREAGYLAAWKKGGGPVEPHTDPYLLPRVRVHGRTTMKDFQRKVTSGQQVQAMRMKEMKVASAPRRFS